MPLKFDMDTIRMMSLFEKITGVQPRDCIISGEEICFVVNGGKAGLAIGKNGRTVNQMEALFKKSVRVFEWSDNTERFVKNLIPPAKNIRIEDAEGKKVVSATVSATDRPTAIGRAGKNINMAKLILQRSCDIHDIRLQRQRRHQGV